MFTNERDHSMNGTIPPPPGDSTGPKTSNLAIWSLVLGILSLFLFCFSIFAAIPGVICGHSALSKIKRSGGTLEGQGLAIAGLVTGYLGIALAFIMIPLMAAIAIPNFVKARSTAQKNACINNLRLIDGAKQQWALENNQNEDAIPHPEDLNKFLPRSFDEVKCPAGGTYSINRVADKPVCSIPEHHLPEPQ
jgi:hypothetical protein